MRWKKELKSLNERQKKGQLAISILLIAFCLIGLSWVADLNGLHLHWEKAFYGTERSYGYGPSEKILLTKDEDAEGLAFMGNGLGQGGLRYAVGRLQRTETEGYLSMVRILKGFPFGWIELHGSPLHFAGAAEAHYENDARWMLGSCQNPEIREVYLEWGYRQKNGEWTALDEIVLPVDAGGFFSFEISIEKWKELLQKELWGYRKEGERLLEGIGVKYLEGRNTAGEVIYTKWMDETGKLVDAEDS